jgi:hypothetical protein
MVQIAEGMEAVVEHLAQPAKARSFADQNPYGSFDWRAAPDFYSFADDEFAVRFGVQLNWKIGRADTDAIPDLHIPAAMDPNMPEQLNVPPDAGSVPIETEHGHYESQTLSADDNQFSRTA